MRFLPPLQVNPMGVLDLEKVMADTGGKPRKLLINMVNDGVETIFKETSEDREGGMIPTWLALHENGELDLIFTPWTGEAHKYAYVEALKLFFSDKKTVAYVMANEVWIGSNEEIQPSLDPKRKEAVILLGVDSGGVTQGTRDINRDDDDLYLSNYVEGLDTDNTGHNVGGIMINLLPGSNRPMTKKEIEDTLVKH